MRILNTIRTLSLSLIGSIALMGTAQANELTFELKPFEAVYTVKKLGVSLGKAYFTLKDLGNNRWEYSSYIKPSGMASLFSSDRIRESSIIEVANNQFAPINYTYVHTGDNEEKATVAFDWQNKTAQVVYNGKLSNHSLLGGEQDHYSLVLNLMKMAATGVASKTMTVINKDIKSYNYASKSLEQVKTPIQKFSAIKIVQTGGSSRSLHYWLSPEANFVPVKIEQHKRGKKKLEMVLHSLVFK